MITVRVAAHLDITERGGCRARYDVGPAHGLRFAEAVQLLDRLGLYGDQICWLLDEAACRGQVERLIDILDTEARACFNGGMNANEIKVEGK